METRTLTILFTDIQGYTETTSRLSREEGLAMVRSHRDFVRPWIEHHAFHDKIAETRVVREALRGPAGSPAAA